MRTEYINDPSFRKAVREIGAIDWESSALAPRRSRTAPRTVSVSLRAQYVAIRFPDVMGEPVKIKAGSPVQVVLVGTKLGIRSAVNGTRKRFMVVRKSGCDIEIRRGLFGIDDSVPKRDPISVPCAYENGAMWLDLSEWFASLGA